MQDDSTGWEWILASRPKKTLEERVPFLEEFLAQLCIEFPEVDQEHLQQYGRNIALLYSIDTQEVMMKAARHWIGLCPMETLLDFQQLANIDRMSAPNFVTGNAF